MKSSSRPHERTLAAATALAGLHGLWSLFEWTQLVSERQGAGSFCVLGASDACAEVWDSTFATWVHAWTGLPVAGWGVVWSVVAFVLPLEALVRRAGQRTVEPFWSATVWTAVAGLGAVLVLAATLFHLGRLCTTCAVTYAMVLPYAAVCLLGSGRLARAQLVRGAGVALGFTVAAFLVLLVPGARTPGRTAPLRPPTSGPPGSTQDALADWIASLRVPVRQTLSDTLALYRASPLVAQRPPRALIGPSDAPVRITEFTDVLCGHCATLHQALNEFRAQRPDGVAIDSRQFPLDGACNPHVERTSEDAVRCTAARVLICLEGDAAAFELAGALFSEQAGLNEGRIYELAAPFVDPKQLASCVEAPETEAKLRSDIGWAVALGIQGTPLVLLNGRQAPNFAPLLYALVLARGNADHPAFAALPPAALPGE